MRYRDTLNTIMPDWTEIRDYETPPAQLARAELRALAQVWREQRQRLAQGDAFRRFEERLKREWAIETGLIERLYTLDRGVTELLIEHGVKAALIPHGSTPDPDSVVSMIEDHREAVEGVFEFVKGVRLLSTSYIKELHALMTRRQETVEGVDAFGRETQVPLRRGDYKLQPNNPVRPDGTVHHYCPPEHVASEMERLIAMHLGHDDVAPEVEAAWLHHRFTRIHPFQDGNGRIARALATLVFVKAGWFPLVVRDRDRARYIDALEAGDAGNLADLVEYFARLQKDAFMGALGISEDVLESRGVDDAIKSIGRQLARRRDPLAPDQESVKSVAAHLCRLSKRRLEEVAEKLRETTQDVLEHPEFSADSAVDDERGDYYRNQIVETAKTLGYFVNTQTWRAWSRLVIRNANQTELLIAFHGAGREFRGVLACSATWFQRMETGDGQSEPGPVTPLTDEVFQINYKETQQEAEKRFLPWLESAILRGLELWRSNAL